MSTDTVADIFEKPGVPYSTSTDDYSTTTIGAALPTVETASVVNPPMGGGGPSSDPLVITFNPLVPIPTPPDMTVDVPITPINVAPYFTGGATPKAYSIFSGTLPPGLALNSTTGNVSGTPSSAVSASIVFRGTDNAGNNANSNSVVFTVASAADPYWADVVLLAHMEGGVWTDSSTFGQILTASGGAARTTAQSKWGLQSADCVANTASVKTTGTDNQRIAGISDPFALEFWIQFTSVATGIYFGVSGYDGGTPVYFRFTAPGVITGRFGGQDYLASTVVSVGPWYYVKFSRTAPSSSKFFIGTVQQATAPSAAAMAGATAYWAIGGDAAISGAGTGGRNYTDEVRLTIGSDRASTDGVIPTGAFPDTGPVALNALTIPATANTLGRALVLTNLKRTVTTYLPVGQGMNCHTDSLTNHSTGKWYVEFVLGAQTVGGGGFSSQRIIGVIPATYTDTYGAKIGNAAGSGTVWRDDGNTLSEGAIVGSVTGLPWGTNDVIGVAWDAATGKIWFAKNNVWIRSGNPSADATPVTTDATIAGVNCQFSVAQDSNNGSGSVPATWAITVNNQTAQLTYPPPTGFTAWG